MKRIAYLLAAVLITTASSFAQVEFRNPDVSAAEEDGGAVYHASTVEDTGQRIQMLQNFLTQYQDSKYRPYGLYLTLVAAGDAQQFEVALPAGQELLGLAPDDLEVRHRVNQALVGLQRWDELAESVDQTKPLADASAGEEGDSGDYARGVIDWLGWASNTALLAETEPAKKVAWLDRLGQDYADSQYGQGLEAKYIQTYQQAGDNANVVVWMKKAVDAGIEDEGYLYTLAEDALAQQNNDAAQEYADKALAVLETKEKPEGMADEQWEAHKTRMTGYANFAAGRAWVGRNTKPAYRTGRTHLLEAVDVIQAEGGARYNVLAYYLGVCYVQLDIQGDNIRSATRWMGEAAKGPGPFVEQAKQALAGIRGAQ